MRWLAFDTCLDACSAAVLGADGAVLAARCEPMRQGHAERLFPMIEAVLADADWCLGDVGTVAVTNGPGTFTGTRIGVAAARAIALATGATIFTASSLALLAATARPLLSAAARTRPIAVCLDARKGEVMLAVSDNLPPPLWGRSATRKGSAVRLLTPDAAATAVLAEAPEAILIGAAAGQVAEAAAALGHSLEHALPDALPDARQLGAVALTQTPDLKPLYLRPPDAKPQIDKSLARMP